MYCRKTSCPPGALIVKLSGLFQSVPSGFKYCTTPLAGPEPRFTIVKFVLKDLIVDPADTEEKPPNARPNTRMPIIGIALTLVIFHLLKALACFQFTICKEKYNTSQVLPPLGQAYYLWRIKGIRTEMSKLNLLTSPSNY
ncbi:MAG: hypothetical protein QW707_06330 [Candidatus Bathyarchaeia archaeon]